MPGLFLFFMCALPCMLSCRNAPSTLASQQTMHAAAASAPAEKHPGHPSCPGCTGLEAGHRELCRRKRRPPPLASTHDRGFPLPLPPNPAGTAPRKLFRRTRQPSLPSPYTDPAPPQQAHKAGRARSQSRRQEQPLPGAPRVLVLQNSSARVTIVASNQEPECV